MLEAMNKHAGLFESEENRAFAEKKVALKALKSTNKILLDRQKMEQENFDQNIKWLQDKKKEKQTEKRQQEVETAKFRYKFDEIEAQLKEIEQQVYLMKRYTV